MIDREKINNRIKQTKSEIDETLTDMFDSLKTIKGEDFADAVRFVSGIGHFAKMVSLGTQEAPDAIREAIGQQYATVAAGGASLILRLMKASEEDTKEILVWSEKIGENIDTRMDALSKFINKEVGR